MLSNGILINQIYSLMWEILEKWSLLIEYSKWIQGNIISNPFLVCQKACYVYLIVRHELFS